jgi:hypothetical protein
MIKKIPGEYLFATSVRFAPSVSLCGGNSTTKYPVSPAFQPSTDSIPVLICEKSTYSSVVRRVQMVPVTVRYFELIKAVHCTNVF